MVAQVAQVLECKRATVWNQSWSGGAGSTRRQSPGVLCGKGGPPGFKIQLQALGSHRPS
jgi:hypothetical protein